MFENLLKTLETPWKPLKTPWKPLKTSKNLWKSLKTPENHLKTIWKPLKTIPPRPGFQRFSGGFQRFSDGFQGFSGVFKGFSWKSLKTRPRMASERDLYPFWTHIFVFCALDIGGSTRGSEEKGEGRGRGGKGEGALQSCKTKLQDSYPVSLFLLSQGSNLKPPHFNFQISSLTKLRNLKSQNSNLQSWPLRPQIS